MRISDWSSDVCSSDLRLVRRDLRDRDVADHRIGLGEKPADLLDRHGREAVPLAFDEPLLRHFLERVGGYIFGGDPRPLLLQRGLDSGRYQLFRFITPNAGVGEAYRRPPAKVERLDRSEEHTSELQSLMRISYSVFSLNKKK